MLLKKGKGLYTQSVTIYNTERRRKAMAKYRKSMRSGVIRIPQEVREAFGYEIEMIASLRAVAIYPANIDKKVVIKSLQLIADELKSEKAIEKDEKVC